MEFLRFGSSIPGKYWGCCAIDIIQDFKYDPSAKASIQLVSGDSGTDLGKFAGPTYEDIFRTRIRIGTMGVTDMPNHAFFVSLTEGQLSGGFGKKWLKILKEEGFEFIRSVDNSVYTGSGVLEEPGEGSSISSHVNHIFGLFRNIGKGSLKNQFIPPKEWTKLSSAVLEAYSCLSEEDQERVTLDQQKFQLARWKANSPTKLLTQEEVVKAGAPVIMAGQRLEGAAPETEEKRLARSKSSSKSNPFGKKPLETYNPEEDYDLGEDYDPEEDSVFDEVYEVIAEEAKA